MKLSSLLATAPSSGTGGSSAGGAIDLAPSTLFGPSLTLGVNTTAGVNCSAALTTIANLVGPGVVTYMLIQSIYSTTNDHRVVLEIDGVTIFDTTVNIGTSSIPLITGGSTSSAAPTFKYSSSFVVKYQSASAPSASIIVQSFKTK